MRATRTAFALALLLPLTAHAAGDPSLRVTTDTAEYCGSLAARLTSMRRVLPDAARVLVADGVRLCGTGHVRTGVAKLRRAFRLAQPE